MEVPGLGAALRQHEARVGSMLEAHRAELATAIWSPSDQSAQKWIAQERAWWSEAVYGQIQELQSVIKVDIQRNAAGVQVLQSLLAELRNQDLLKIRTEMAALRSGLERQPAVGEELQRIRSDVGALLDRLDKRPDVGSQVQQQQQQLHDSSHVQQGLQRILTCADELPRHLEDKLEYDRRERQAQLAMALENDLRERQDSDAGLRGQLEQQGASLRELSRGLAGLHTLLEPNSAAPRAKAPPGQPLQGEGALGPERRAPQADRLSEGQPPALPATSSSPDSECQPPRPDDQPKMTSVPSAFTFDDDDEGCDEPDDVSPIRRRARAITNDKWFTVGSGIAIVINCILLGIEADDEVRSSGHSENELLFKVLEMAVTVVFVSELALRWLSHGRSFLAPGGPMFVWNTFDIVLVGTSVLELFLWLISVESVKSFAFLRLARLLRLARMMRMFKAVRGFKELRLMVNGILNSLKPLIWGLVLILSLTYMTAIYMLQVSTTHLKNALTDDDPESQAFTIFINTHFSSLGWAMYSLFKCLAGGAEWGLYGDQLWNQSPFPFVAFTLYVVFGMFCMLNLMTAVFVEAANRNGNAEELIFAKKDWMHEAKAFFKKQIHVTNATQSSGLPDSVRMDGFVSMLSHTESLAWLEENGLDLFLEGKDQLEDLFRIMDDNGNGCLDIDEFVSGLYALQGPCRALEMKFDNQKLMSMISELQRSLK